MFYKTKISPKSVSLVFSILVICFVIVFYVSGWQEPTQLPPQENIAAPLNAGGDPQSKSGGLILCTGASENCLSVTGTTNGLIVTSGYAIFETGNVGIGMSAPLSPGLGPEEKLEVVGNIKAQGFISAISGQPGASQTITVGNGFGSTCQITFENGLFISSTCP